MSKTTTVLAIAALLSALAITAITFLVNGIGDANVSSNVSRRNHLVGDGDGHPGYVYAPFGYRPYTVPYAYKPYREPYAPYAPQAPKAE